MLSNELTRPLEDFKERVTGTPRFWAEIYFAQISLGRNVLLLGPQGCGKTSVARLASDFLGVESFEYSAVTDDLYSSVGIPKPSRLAEGVFELAIHDRSILACRGDVVFIDEITRAAYGSANLWLQILDRKVFSRDTNIMAGAVIAACNPSTGSFSGAIPLDAALLDRFHCVLEPPTELSDENIADILSHFASGNKETTKLADGRPLQELLVEERKRRLRDADLCHFLCRVYLPQVRRRLLDAQREHESDRQLPTEAMSPISVRAMERCFDVIVDLLAMLEITEEVPLREFCDAVEFAAHTALFHRSSLSEEVFFHCLFPLSQDLRRFVTQQQSRLDPVSRLSHGTKKERVLAFRSLDRSRLNEHDRERLSLLLTKLAYEVCDGDSLEDAASLWWGLDDGMDASLKELLEAQMLRSRINSLLHDDLPQGVGPAVLRNVFADPVMWSPGSPTRPSKRG